jgi:glycosyltransferase involved in cell wall biosynthesis/phosphoheptose isomerase
MTRQVALISEHASPLSVLGGVDCGGQNLYVGQVAKSLASLGYDVDVFTRRDSEVLPETAEWVNGVRIIHVPAGPPSFVRKEDLLPYMKEFTEYMLKFCRCQRKAYDLVHANFWMSGLVAAELKKQLGTPFVITFHALGRVRRQFQRQADEFPDARFEIEDRIVAEADHIIAEAPQDEEDLIRLYNADPSNITIIPCGFDSTELWPISKTLAKISLGLPPEERVILHLGRMVPRKGTETVVQAFGRLVHRHGIAARLLIVGGESDDPDPAATPEIARLQQIARDEGVADGVTFVGRRGRDTLKFYYSAADIFVTTPWYEPFGITPVEAMACGTPVVGSNVGGIKFTVRDGETGYLVFPKDPDCLAEKIAHLYANPKLLTLFGRQAIQRVNDLFTWNKIAKGLSALYEQVVSAKQPADIHREDHLALVDAGFDAAMESMQDQKRRLRSVILDAAHVLRETFVRGGKVLICASPGRTDAAERLAMHLRCLTVSGNRPGLPTLCLDDHSSTADPSLLEDSLVRQVHLFGRPEDVLIGIGFEGDSSVLRGAFEAAGERGLHSIAILGTEATDIRRLVHLTVTLSPPGREAVESLYHIMLQVWIAVLQQQLALADQERMPATTLHSMWGLPRTVKVSNSRRRMPVQRTKEVIK